MCTVRVYLKGAYYSATQACISSVHVPVNWCLCDVYLCVCDRQQHMGATSVALVYLLRANGAVYLRKFV